MASGWTRFPRAEKNLLKIFISNRHTSLQVVHNNSARIFLWASTIEKSMRERLPKTWDVEAARAAATLLAQRAKEAGQQQLTYERGRQRYEGKVKAVIDTLREHGIEFVQHAGSKKKLRRPWEPPPVPP